MISLRFFFSSRRRHTRWPRDWSSDVCSSDLVPRSPDGQEAQGVRRGGAPAPGSAAGALRVEEDRPARLGVRETEGSTRRTVVEPTGIEDVATQDIEGNSEDFPAEYTSETPDAAPAGYVPTASGPGAGTGRRKKAIARVRITPGSGEWKVNGKPLEDYFPDKVHQQVIKEPLVALGFERSEEHTSELQSRCHIV